ncbi:mucoidy inhibitor MuiA family protein [Muricauda sp. CAU 1633]|uniref:mucoidy inhibitor MuiA family protein n=1 Tax=Allomuricauda sp. CAU 1633 TaxID=2816036 RepID=UPI001A8E0D67|nr:mucoidy inhibitor MuiA family protein [Muricauda sp. CAU 1633]MBO0323137.1 mucoidy inhibitor MuiA family protein [Muricauda sp. CAU 1633]
MKTIALFFLSIPLLLFPNTQKQPSKIKEVTVYLSGAQITRTAECHLNEGSNEVIFAGLSHKIDESSIQISGLNAVSILSIAYNINYLEKSESNPMVKEWEDKIKTLEHKIALLKNTILGLEEEEKVITSNRLVNSDSQTLDLEQVKRVSQYYRERITAIKNEIFKSNLNINETNLEIIALQKQLVEANSAPEEEQGEISIKFDAPIATNLNLTLTYLVEDAGWVPNYDIKSTGLNAPLNLAYKANVYQKTGQDWNNVKMVLSTESPNYNIAKPNLEAKYLNFVSSYQRRYSPAAKKKGYAFNPNVKKVVGTITDESGQPLPGVNVVIKGSSHGTTTDFDGNYSLDVPYGQELTYSYIGMVPQELPIYSSIMNVDMEEDAAMLEEVVVTGYGEDISRTLQGKAAGVSIRGYSSVSGSIANSRVQYQPPAPLYIVDGIPMTNFSEGDLDENEIQDIEILKGANAGAIYGNQGSNGVVIITTKKSHIKEGATKTAFEIKKTYSIKSDGDITAIEINTFKMPASYEYFAAPVINENVFLTASFKDWEQHQLLPGEANIYFEGTYAGKTVLDPYTTKKEMVLSLGIDNNITVSRQQDRNFKSKSFTGSNRILDRTYNLEVKNNKNVAVTLKLMDRIPMSQDKEIKVDDVVTNNASYDDQKGLLTWSLALTPQESKKENFSFQVKYPRGRYISL